ncbi:hypothetical protein Tco_0852907, partial [Tanacetum coccineum]
TQPSTSQPQKTQKLRKPKRKNTQVPQPSGSSDNVANKVVHKELDDSLVRAATTASSLEAEQDSGAKKPWGILLLKLGLRKYLNFPMIYCSQETTHAEEIVSLKRRVKKLEQKKRSRTHGLKRLYKVGLTSRVESSRDEESLGDEASKLGRINDIDADEDITLVNDQDDDDVEMVDVMVKKFSTAATTKTITTKELTLAQALEALKTSKPKVKRIVNSTTTTTTISSKDKGKGIIVEEPVKMKKKDQISFDEQEAKRLQAEFDEEERLAREKAQQEQESNVSLTEEWDDIQAKVDADYQLAQRLQAEEKEEFFVEEKAKLFQQLLEIRRKHFAVKRAEEQRNKPPTKAQQKKTMITYLKNMEGWKHKDLRSKDFNSIKELFDEALKRVNMFVDFRTELVKGSSKRVGTELEQEVTKKQKVDDVQDHRLSK